MTRRFPLYLAVLLSLGPSIVRGQTTGGTTRTTTGGTTTGGTTTGGTTSLTMGGTGASAAGGGAAGGTGALTQPALTQFGQAGANIGTGFVGRGNNAQTFVGQANAGQQTIDAGGTARFSGFGGSGGGGATTNISQARGGQMRIARQIAFDLPVTPAPVLQATLQTQFAALQARLPGVAVLSSEPGHVVLQGTVDSDHARKLAEAVARMEPGVRRITNDLQVAGNEPLVIPPRLVR